MKRRARQVVLAGLAIASLALSVSPVGARLFGRKRLRYPYLSRAISEQSYARLGARPGWSKSRLQVATGVRLNGLVRRPTANGASWLLFYPGNDESQLERGQAFLARLAGERDLGLAVFAYRGYDSSDGRTGLSDMRADAPVIASELCRVEGVPAGHLHIVGFSIGGYFASAAAAGRASAGQAAASLTLLASVNDIVMFHRSPWEKLSAGEDYQTSPLLGPVPAPVLLLQGTADSAFGGPEQGRALSQVLGSRVEYHELPNVDHVPLLSDPTALELVRSFVDRHSK